MLHNNRKQGGQPNHIRVATRSYNIKFQLFLHKRFTISCAVVTEMKYSLELTIYRMAVDKGAINFIIFSFYFDFKTVS